MTLPGLFIQIPAILIALFQSKVIWSIWLFHHPFKFEDTEIYGQYSYTYNHLFPLGDKLIKYLFIFQFLLSYYSLINFNLTNISLIIFAYLLIIFGFFLSLKALKSLGNNWTGMFHYRIIKKQKLITTGPYKSLRHPIYTSLLFEIIGFELLNLSVFSILICLVVFFVINYHINNEEKLLLLKFPEYPNYRRHTYKLIPFIF
jgi:protein-S-isoprenylcysteine O-methyltransferase Ste14